MVDETTSNGRRSANASPQPHPRPEEVDERGGASSTANGDGNGVPPATQGRDGELVSAEGDVDVDEEEIDASGTSGGFNQGGRGPARGRQSNENGHAGMEPTSAIKLLVSAALAGCLIGKGGATINELQERTGARIKLSQNNDYFPGAFSFSRALNRSIDCRYGS